MLSVRSHRFQIPEAQHQFGGFGGVIGGGVGIAIPAFGSTGFTGATGGAGGGFLAPLMTLQTVFGQSFSAATVAQAIEVADQQARLAAERGESSGIQTVIDIATSPEGLQIVLNLARGLFEILDASGRKLAGGVTPEAAIEALSASGPLPEGGAAPEPPIFPTPSLAVPTAPFVAPPPPPQQDPNLFGAIQALISLLRPPPTFEEIVFGPPRRTPQPSDFPIDFPTGVEPFPDVFGFPPGTFPQMERIGPGIEQIRPQQIEQAIVRPGGTVNVPVVLGATGDPTGVRRPQFPDQEQLAKAQRIGQLIRDFLALRKARQTADKQRRAFEQFLAARLEILRGGQQMPFGQSGFAVGGLGGGAIGALTDLAISAGGAFLADRFGPSVPVSQFGQFPAAPVQGPLLGVGGGGGGCPPLFRTGAPAGFSMRPVPWFPVQAPNGKWFFFGHLGTPTFSRLKARRRHHHHRRLR